MTLNSTLRGKIADWRDLQHVLVHAYESNQSLIIVIQWRMHESHQFVVGPDVAVDAGPVVAIVVDARHR